MPIKRVIVNTSGERFYNITDQVTQGAREDIAGLDGILYIFTMHTSCALTINESFDPSAKTDMENFLKHLAPRNLQFITHDDEGPDDSPSHMKSILLNQNLCLPVQSGEIIMGQWQGIYLAEFRDDPKKREVILKFIEG